MEKEIRYITGSVEYRAGEEGDRSIEGYAFKYNKESKNLGGFNEVILPGALDEANMDDVVGLFNHRMDNILGRNSSGTLELVEDEVGLKYRINVANTTTGNDVLELVKRGDVSGSSFAFSLSQGGETWEERDNALPLRKIKNFQRIYDVSPVTDPAYADTSVAKRGFEKFTEIVSKTKFSNRHNITATWLKLKNV